MKPVKTKINWIQICSYSAFGRIAPHSHDFFHWIYIIQGSGAMVLEDEQLELKPRHLYLVAPGKVHSFWNCREERLLTCELKFNFIDVSMTKKVAEYPPCVNADGTPILGILQNIRREHAAKKTGSADIIAMNLQEICIHIQRVRQSVDGTKAEPVREDLGDVIDYIENNLDCDINLQDLANIVCLEKSYFLKKFKQLTGVTPMVYTRNVRIKKAKELLEFSDMNITQIAIAVGFQSVHHFSRHFASVTGMSPSKYKKEHV